MPTNSTDVWLEQHLIGGAGYCSAQLLMAKPTKMAKTGRLTLAEVEPRPNSGGEQGGRSIDQQEAHAFKMIRSSDVNMHPAPKE